MTSGLIIREGVNEAAVARPRRRRCDLSGFITATYPRLRKSWLSKPATKRPGISKQRQFKWCVLERASVG